MSDKINLNSEEFDGGGAIFNNGIAGVVENVKVSIERKQADQADNFPDYRLKFLDSGGGTLDKVFYYADESHINFSKRLKGLGTELKHIWGVLVGKDTPIPEFSGHKEMLDTMMSSFNDAVKEAPDNLYRTVVTYGSKDYPQKYLRIPFFPPYFESMLVKPEESRIAVPRNSRMIPFVEDAKDEAYDNVHSDPDAKKDDSSGWV